MARCPSLPESASERPIIWYGIAAQTIRTAPTALRVHDSPHVERAFIVGSWAARYLGEPGPQPRDVDIVVVGHPAGRDLRRANARLEERLGVPVQVTVVTETDWETQASGFVQDVRSKPLVGVFPVGES